MTGITYHTKSIDELTFTDDGMFQAVLHEPEICAELVERLLHVKVNHVEYPKIEKQIAPYYSSKGVRLDVYIRDSDKIIDVEMQSYPQEAPGKRTRYYQSMIDKDVLPSGTKHYTELKNFFLFSCARLQCLIKSGICTHSAMSASKTLKLGWRTELPSFSFVLMAR